MKNLKNNEKGIALLIVIWVVVLLMALATEFAVAMRTEVRSASNFKEDFESYYLARAGINLAMAEILKKAKYHSIDEDGFIVGVEEKKIETEGKSATEEEEENAEPEYPVPTRSDISLGYGTVTYTIEDENKKVNLNAASRGILVKILKELGMELGEERDIIVDSILDWKDSDDNHRLNGAESDYYKTLDPPYKAKNAKFDTVEELSKVRGVTEELLYGLKNDKEEDDESASLGLIDFFTVQNIGSFNPNTASREMLSLYYEEEQLEKVLEDRDSKGFYNNSTSTHFKITSTGEMSDSAIRHTIVAVFEKIGTDKKASLLIRYWNDNFIQDEE